MPETIALHPAIAQRWSPRTFSSRPVPEEILRSLFEAARWAASCFNEQPWRFVVATRDNPEEFRRLLEVLVPANQAWAVQAWALAISTGKKTFTQNGKPNLYGLHDAGQALANLSIQATAAGLHVHAMGGFDRERARTDFGVPDDYEMGAAFAIGYIEGPPEPPAARSRRPLAESVFGTTWGVSPKGLAL